MRFSFTKLAIRTVIAKVTNYYNKTVFNSPVTFQSILYYDLKIDVNLFYWRSEQSAWYL